MTVISKLSTGASSAMNWDIIPWNKANQIVHRLQMRISKAAKEGKRGKVKALQRLLTCSFYAKLLAVKRVTSNRGKGTPGIDKIVWKSSREKREAAQVLKRRGYSPLPLRRCYIPKKGNASKQRPLGIPAMKDRAMQALHLFALEPIAEIKADKNSYGFRTKRSCADAIEQCFAALAKKRSARWILEGDIKSCFDTISHEWLSNNIPMDKKILCSWLKSGYMENKIFHCTEAGTPQGGIISPVLANMTLDGLEKLFLDKYIKDNWNKQKVNFIRYADDFIVTGNSKEILEQEVKPMIESFLAERGLILSQEKTKITHIDEGFDFLGFNLRKYGDKLLIKPAKKNVLGFLKNIGALIKIHKTSPTDALIRLLNSRIHGWANYYRHAISSDTFSYVDYRIFQSILRWTKKRHPEKNAQWRRKKYFRTHKERQWIFHARVKNKEGIVQYLDLFHATSVKIKRHIKIKAEATPFDPDYKEYFVRRDKFSTLNCKKDKWFQVQAMPTF